MTITRIPREEWAEFCERFTGQHAGGLVTVVLRRPGQGEQVVARTQRMVRLIANGPTRGPDGLAITWRTPKGANQTYALSGVRQIGFVQNEAGAHLGLDVHNDDQTLSVRFRVPVLPETVDGVLQVS